MSVGQYRTMCQKYTGKAVEIRCNDGKVHRGIIQRVGRNHVYLQPMRRSKSLGGFSYGGYGYGSGWGWGIALGAITGIALISLFWI